MISSKMSNFGDNSVASTPMDNLQRFLDGQRFGYETALNEMKAGEKRNHWIWYIFPQIKGLGHSPNAQYYGIKDLDEAKAYLEHPVLGVRLREITQEVHNHSNRGIYAIMGARIDVMKFKSSMTLFDAVSPKDIFVKALDTFFKGSRDKQTIELINE